MDLALELLNYCEVSGLMLTLLLFSFTFEYLSFYYISSSLYNLCQIYDKILLYSQFVFVIVMCVSSKS